MRHLCYVFIKNYKALENIGLKVDGRFDFHYDPDENVLRIKKNEALPNNFWGTGVYSLTAVVGNNGAGKSMSLSFILESLVDGASRDSVDGILVYFDGGTLEVYGEDIHIETDLRYTRLTYIPKLNCFYYSAHFLPYVSYSDLRASELSGGYNGSDNWLLVKDVESYAAINSQGLSYPIDWHLRQFVALNNYRICSMLEDDRIYDSFKDFFLPKYILFGINHSGYYALLDRIKSIKRMKEIGLPVTPDEEKIELPPRRIIHPNSKDRFFENNIYYSLLNFMNGTPGWTCQEAMDTLTEWQNWKNDSCPILDQFASFSAGRNNHQKELLTLHSVLSRINKVCRFHDNGATQCFYLDTKTDRVELHSLLNDSAAKSLFFVGKVFDMYYSQDINSTTILSSGEQQLLDLFSRLYDAIILSPEKYENIKSKRLILLDEAEIGFHPEWQRKYVDLLIRFLEILYESEKTDEYAEKAAFQVIISTHSPILLSDIPSCCVTFLRRSSDCKTLDVSESFKGNTFAANVFEQFRYSFFLEDGLVGRFAERKLEEAMNNLKNKKCLEEAKKVTDLVGDERIRTFLQNLNPIYDWDEKIRSYEKRIEYLKRERNSYRDENN